MLTMDALSAMRCIHHELPEDKNLDRNKSWPISDTFPASVSDTEWFSFVSYVSTSHGSGSAVETQQIMSRTTKTSILLIQMLVLLFLLLLTTRSHLQAG
jgi:hypothetical protein